MSTDLPPSLPIFSLALPDSVPALCRPVLRGGARPDFLPSFPKLERCPKGRSVSRWYGVADATNVGGSSQSRRPRDWEVPPPFTPRDPETICGRSSREAFVPFRGWTASPGKCDQGLVRRKGDRVSRRNEHSQSAALTLGTRRKLWERGVKFAQRFGNASIYLPSGLGPMRLLRECGVAGLRPAPPGRIGQ